DDAWFLRAIQWLKAKATGATMPDMRVTELKRAEINVVKCVQREAFPSIAEKVKKTSCIYRLEPIRLDDGLLHVGGRLHSHPIILPKCHDVVDLIISNFHEVSGH